MRWQLNENLQLLARLMKVRLNGQNKLKISCRNFQKRQKKGQIEDRFSPDNGHECFSNQSLLAKTTIPGLNAPRMSGHNFPHAQINKIG